MIPKVGESPRPVRILAGFTLRIAIYGILAHLGRYCEGLQVDT